MCCDGITRFMISSMSQLHKVERVGTMPGRSRMTNLRTLHRFLQCAHYCNLAMQLASAEAACISSTCQLPSLVQFECIAGSIPKRKAAKSFEGSAHHEIAIFYMVSQEAGEGLEDLAHGAVADDDDALTLEALGEVRGIHRVQVARVWL